MDIPFSNRFCNEPLNRLENVFENDSSVFSLTAQFLNTESTSEKPGLLDECASTQEPYFTCSESKETVVTNFFNGLNPAEGASFFSDINRSSNGLTDGLTDSLAESWPDGWLNNEGSPSRGDSSHDKDAHSGFVNADAMGSIGAGVMSASATGNYASEITMLRSELACLKGALWAAESKIRDLTYGTDNRMSYLEQRYQQDQIRISRIRHAQDAQLERRLEHYIKKSIVEAMQQAMDKFIRVRRSVIPEPATQPSTYSVPDRPEGTGVFS